METASFIPRETEETIRLEKLLAQRVEKAWNVKAEKIPSTYQLDYALQRDGVIKSWAELKCRTHAFGTYPTYMISLKKWNACREFHLGSHLKAFLVVGFTDGDYWMDTDVVKDFEVKMGGRSDRDWSVDREPCVFFSVSYFRKFK